MGATRPWGRIVEGPTNNWLTFSTFIGMFICWFYKLAVAMCRLYERLLLPHNTVFHGLRIYCGRTFLSLM